MNRAERFLEQREHMLEKQLKSRGITNNRVLNAFRNVPREEFLPPDLHSKAYEDCPLPIGFDQTISQPYIVALMTERLNLEHNDRVLEIGTGCGYQTAILSELTQAVYSIEINKSFYQDAETRLGRLGHHNVHLKCADGRLGWQEMAPFDKMTVAAGAEKIPEALIEQLKEGGLIVIPVGSYESQVLVLGQKVKGTLVTKELIPVRFVSLK